MPGDFDAEQLADWVAEHAGLTGLPSCPLCQGRNWGTGDTLYELRRFSQRAALGGPVAPLVLISCGDCGYIMFLSALKAGLVQTQP